MECFDIGICELDSLKAHYHELKKGKLGDQELERDYALFFIETIKQTKVFTFEEQNELQNEKENEDEAENENENGNETDKDPQYCMFLENLTENGKSYKLKASQNDQEPRFVYYEEPGDSDRCDDLQTSTDNSGDEVTVSEDMQMNQKLKMRLNGKKKEVSAKKEVSRRNKFSNHKSTTDTRQVNIIDPLYEWFLNNIPSEYREEEPVEYEKKASDSDTDTDIVIWDNVENCSDVNSKQKKLREKLMHILKQPYNEKEYEELSGYMEQEKPVCRLLPLRGRSISSAVGGVKKSMLDQGPGSFRWMYNAAHNDRPKALNLLRMFRFWLEHVPDEGVFEPWKDEHLLQVQPSEKNALKGYATAAAAAAFA